MKGPKRKRGGRSAAITSRDLEKKLIDLLRSHSDRMFHLRQLCAKLKITGRDERDRLEALLRDLDRREIIDEKQSRCFAFRKKTQGVVDGVIEINQRGDGLVAVPGIPGGVSVSRCRLRNALSGDRVKVRLFSRRKGNSLEGEVVEILSRSGLRFVGTVEVSGGIFIVAPLSRKLPGDVYIPPGQLNGADGGDLIVAVITDWPLRHRLPCGRILEVLGRPGESDAEMKAILAEFDLPGRFPDKVTEAAEKIPAVIDVKELRERRDFRGLPTFTVDPEDAWDFDDALSLESLDNEIWRVGVHIADVTHYVKKGSIIDKEAAMRGTSVYLTGRVVPMLPDRLSNRICSLVPGEDRLCFSIVFDLNERAEVMETWIGRSVIRSQRRFTYEQVQETIQKCSGEFGQEIFVLRDFAQILRNRRFDRGAVAFDTVEVKISLDEDGRPADIRRQEHKEAHRLIEEFMLMANRCVAERIGRVKKGRAAGSFVYRVHGKPDTEKMMELIRFTARLGYCLDIKKEGGISGALNRLLREVSGKPEENLIQTLAIRTMAKAVYSTKNIGHFGLAFNHYTHFTSPIRRYPDMMAHRLLAAYLAGERGARRQGLEVICRHASEMERRAMEAERASIRLKQVQFLQSRVGEVFQGFISGVTDWGIYVELDENHCEGLVPVSELLDDYYVLDEKNHALHGSRTGRKFRLGDRIEIRVFRADPRKRQLDFIPTGAGVIECKF